MFQISYLNIFLKFCLYFFCLSFALYLSNSILLSLFLSSFKVFLLFFIYLSPSVFLDFSPKYPIRLFRSSSHCTSLICQSHLKVDNRQFLQYLLYFLKTVLLFFIFVSKFLFLFIHKCNNVS